MEPFSAEKGVFVPSKDLDIQSLIKFLQVVLDVCPTAKMTSVESDDPLGGFRVYLSDCDSRKILKKQDLVVLDWTIEVYPLTTYLQVHGIEVVPEIRRDLIDCMERIFGRVLHLEQVQPEHGDGSCLMLLDIPEMESLSVFQRNGYPRMTVRVPAINKTFKVTFWCRGCKASDHSHQRCPYLLQEAYGDQSNRFASTSSRNGIEMRSSNPETQTPSALESILFATRTERDPVQRPNHESESADKPNRLSRIIDSLMKTKELQESSSRTGDGVFRNFEPDWPDSSLKSPASKTVVKSEFGDPGMSTLFQNQENLTSPAWNATSTTNDIPIIDLDEDEPHGTTVRGKTSRASEFKLEPGATPWAPQCHQQPGPSTSTPRQKRPTEGLSDQMLSFISQAYSTYSVLDSADLDAFLVHVKKKSNPMRVAKKLTENVEGLENQLKKILELYYRTPEPGTKEDTSFIKWLSGVVERFNGPVSRKRKPSTKKPGGPPAKK